MVSSIGDAVSADQTPSTPNYQIHAKVSATDAASKRPGISRVPYLPQPLVAIEVNERTALPCELAGLGVVAEAFVQIGDRDAGVLGRGGVAALCLMRRIGIECVSHVREPLSRAWLGAAWRVQRRVVPLEL